MLINVLIAVAGLIALAVLGVNITRLFDPGREVSLRDLNVISAQMGNADPGQSESVERYAERLRDAMDSPLLKQLQWRIRKKALLYLFPAIVVLTFAILLSLHRFSFVTLSILKGVL